MPPKAKHTKDTSAAKLPDVIIHPKAKNRLFLIEAVIKASPMDEKRRRSEAETCIKEHSDTSKAAQK